MLYYNSSLFSSSKSRLVITFFPLLLSSAPLPGVVFMYVMYELVYDVVNVISELLGLYLL